MSSLSKAVDVLHLVGGHGTDGIGVNELARQLGLPPSSAHRILKELRRHGLVHQDPVSKRYHLGLGLVVLASEALDGSALRKRMRPHLVRLSEQLGCNCFLTVLHQDRCICLDTVGPAGGFHHFAAVGREMPLNASAAAKAIVAFLPEPDRRRLVDLDPMRPFTPSTVTDREALWRELDEVRQTGFAVCDGDLEEGVKAISVPLISSTGHPLASLTAIAPSTRLVLEAEVVAALRATARELRDEP